MGMTDRDEGEASEPLTPTSIFSINRPDDLGAATSTSIELTAAAVPEIVGLSFIITMLFSILVAAIHAWPLLPSAPVAFAVACFMLRRILRHSWILRRDGVLEWRPALGIGGWRGAITAATDSDATHARANIVRRQGTRVVELTITCDDSTWQNWIHVCLPADLARRMACRVGVEITVDTRPPREIDSN